MKSKVTNLSKNTIKIEIEVEKEALLKNKEEALKKFQSQVKVAGFREGKAPLDLVEKEISHDKLLQEILNLSLFISYAQALKENNLNPISDPEIKIIKFVPSDILTYEAVVALMPQVKLGDWKKIKITKKEIKKITESDIQKFLGELQKQKAIFKEVKREAQKKDRVEIDFEGFLDSKPMEGGTSKNHPLIIGEGSFVSGFEDNLIGLKQNQEKEFEVSFPADFREEKLRGQKVKFKVGMKKVEEVILPEIDDKFALNFGVKDLGDLKEKIKQKLEEEENSKEKKRQEEEVLDKLVETSEVEIPEVLINKEIDQEVKNLEQNLQSYGLTLEKYLGDLKMDTEGFKNQVRPQAEKRLKVSFVLKEIGSQERISVSNDEIDRDTQILKEMNPEREINRAEVEGKLFFQKVLEKVLESTSA